MTTAVTTTALIHLDEIQKSYYMGKQALPVLKGVSLDIFKNEYVALMGPSGSGKSTLMNILGCLDTPTSGAYVLNGQDVSKMTDDSLADVIKNGMTPTAAVDKAFRRAEVLFARYSLG